MKYLLRNVVIPCLCLLLLGVAGMSLSWAVEPNPQDRLMAEPVGSNVYDAHEFSSGVDLSLIINNDQDRVGARFTCDTTAGRPYEDTRCDELTFLFPQLSFDRDKRVITLGGDVVATVGRLGRIRMSKNYRLGYELLSKTFDKGFDRTPIQYVKVFLKHK
jgi:hypothetical protein